MTASRTDSSTIDGAEITWRYDDRGRVEIDDDGFVYVGVVLYNPAQEDWFFSPFRTSEAHPGPTNTVEDDRANGFAFPNCRSAIEALIAHDRAIEAEG